MNIAPPRTARETQTRQPRVGFLGTGWIGRHRMQALVDSGIAQAAVIAEPSAECMTEGAKIAPTARQVETLEELLREDLDGIVIATPSALHADQAVAALSQGVAVFCQKPLARTGSETTAVIEAARSADRLLHVDLSYRHTEAMQEIRRIVAGGEIGHVHAVDLVFHNAYGPDKDWFYDPALAGGGCVMDLGVHLVDLALWTLDFPRVKNVTSHLFANGQPLAALTESVEDFAVATLVLENGTIVRLACSWRLHAGEEAQIAASFYGTQGGAGMRNIDGSFYDFVGERFNGTRRETLTVPPDPWGGRAIIDWADLLSRSASFDPQTERYAAVADVLDRIYRR